MGPLGPFSGNLKHGYAVKRKCGSEYQKEEEVGNCNYVAEGSPGPGYVQTMKEMVCGYLEKEGVTRKGSL